MTVMARKSSADHVLEFARDLGCETTMNPRNQHWRVTYQGRYVGTVAATPSDHRSMLNAKSLIRRNIALIRQEQEQQ